MEFYLKNKNRMEFTLFLLYKYMSNSIRFYFKFNKY